MTLLSCIYFYSFLHGIDPAVTKAVIAVESNNNVYAVGSSHGEIGLMQIRSEFVPENKLQLFNPCTNVKRGTKLLAKAKKSCKHKAELTWINCYNMGLAGASKLRYPKKWPYYVKVTARL